MKKDIFLATRRNIIAISTIIVFACLIVFAVITQTLYSAKVMDNIDKQLLEQRDIINMDVFDFERYLNQMNNPFPKNFHGKPGMHEEDFIRIPPNLIVIVYKDDELKNISRNQYFTENNLPDFSKESENTIVTIDDNGYKFRGIIISKDSYKIQVLSNIDSEVNSIHRLTKTLIISLIILIIVAIVLSAYLASKVIKPVREAYEKQIHFVQDASHEMRTPLAVIKGKLELFANSSKDTIDSHFEHISKIMSEIRGLEKLNTDLLLLSKEDLDLGINITKFSLYEFINDIGEFYIDLADIQGKEFKVIKPAYDVEVLWDYSKIRRAVIILIENAFKYTDDNGKIEFIIEEFNKNIRISVRDNGIGIREEDQERIFDRFYRSDIVRGKNISGTGIGLSLLKSISKNFGIKLNVNSTYGEGSEFTMMIPKTFD